MELGTLSVSFLSTRATRRGFTWANRFSMRFSPDVGGLHHWPLQRRRRGHTPPAKTTGANKSDLDILNDNENDIDIKSDDDHETPRTMTPTTTTTTATTTTSASTSTTTTTATATATTTKTSKTWKKQNAENKKAFSFHSGRGRM